MKELKSKADIELFASSLANVQASLELPSNVEVKITLKPANFKKFISCVGLSLYTTKTIQYTSQVGIQFIITESFKTK